MARKRYLIERAWHTVATSHDSIEIIADSADIALSEAAGQLRPFGARNIVATIIASEQVES